MDPISMDYIMHGQPQRMSSHTDPAIHPTPNGWVSPTHGRPHVSPPANWSPHSSPPVHPYYNAQRVHHPVPHTFPLGQNGGLPSLDPNLRSFSSPDPLGLPMPMRPWPHQYYHIPGPPHTAVQLNPLSINGGAGEMPYAHAAPVSGRGLPFQTPGDLAMTPQGASTEPLPLPRPLFPQPVDHSMNHMSNIPQQAASQFPNPAPPHHFNSNAAHRVGQPASSTIPRAPRSSLPHVSLFTPSSHHYELLALTTPPSDRRRSGHTRARRSMNPRLSAVDPAREGDDDVPHSFRNHAMRPSHRASSSLSYSSLEDATVRQMQVLRGAVSSNTKQVASRGAVQSLLSVNIEDLPENERTCVICYNDYGVKTPEGINEAPLRLPRCKHVFGDHCIKKWFEDSDSCPYCRDKLPSEPKYQCHPARALMNMMRLRGGLPQGLSEDVYVRLVTGMASDGELEDLVPRHLHAAERRSLPDDAGEGQRRIRPRRDSSEDSHSEDDVNDVTHFTSETSAAPVYIPSLDRHSQWISRAAEQRRAAHAALYQVGDAGQQGPVLLPRLPFLSALSSSLSNGLTATDTLQTRGANAAGRQSTDDTSPRGVVEVSGTHSSPATSRQQTIPSLTDQTRNRPW